MKRILLICLALIWLLPQAALAHSKLQDTVPEKDSTSESSPQEIRLTFNTKIEKISSFKLFDAEGEEVALGETDVEGDTMSNRPTAPLANGSYKVKWTIVGADGHAIEGEYGFAVETPVPSATPEPSPSAAPSPTTEATSDGEVSPSPTAAEEEASPSPSPVANEDGEEPDNADSGMSPLLAVGGIIVVVAVAAALLRRRKP
ncbi:copper resistance protein CopC [Paenibacillus sp. LHD-117]|uniref:copper resistance CopC family protein n=1 Tax=Paenibacillus sp. LHD-117 TaxID=3071412 RepID=UPI0027E0E894|nr:copper resistance protein CopC [Paenibacillus sp. LHD-117]MDQ6418580.1 copper resistance protein CopC [Paenibacillus sp. LHD-117]